MKNIIRTVDALGSLAPTAKFIVRGIESGEDEIEWHDLEQAQPSKAEIDAEVIRLQAEYDANQYQRDRQYPNLGEQLDMLFHDMTASKGSKTGEWYKAVAKVKADNPKPE